MNIQKRKAILFALVAPLLLAAVACENKGCDAKVEEPKLGQSAKVDSLYDKIQDPKTTSAELKALFEQVITDEDEAGYLVKGASTGKKPFLCYMADRMVDDNIAEIYTGLFNKLPDTKAAEALAQKCGLSSTVYEALNDSGKVKPEEEPAKRAAVLQLAFKKASKETVQSVISDPIKRAALVKNGKSDPRIVLKLKAETRPEDQASLEQLFVAEGVETAVLDAIAQDVITEASKSIDTMDFAVLKKKFEVVTAKPNEFNKLRKANFLAKMANLPVNATTRSIWEEYDATVANQLEMTNDLIGVGKGPNKPFKMLISRAIMLGHADANKNDVQGEMDTLVGTLLAGRINAAAPNNFETLVNTDREIVRFFRGAVAGGVFEGVDGAYRNVNFNTAKNRAAVGKMVASFDDNAVVVAEVKANVADPAKLGEPDVAVAFRDGDVETGIGLYNILIKDVGGRSRTPNQLYAADNNFSQSLARASFDNAEIKEIWDDYRVGRGANFAQDAGRWDATLANNPIKTLMAAAPGANDDDRRAVVASLLEVANVATVGQLTADQAAANNLLGYAEREQASLQNVFNHMGADPKFALLKAWAMPLMANPPAHPNLTPALNAVGAVVFSDARIVQAAFVALEAKIANDGTFAAKKAEHDFLVVARNVPAMTPPATIVLLNAVPVGAKDGFRNYAQMMAQFPVTAANVEELKDMATNKIGAANMNAVLGNALGGGTPMFFLVRAAGADDDADALKSLIAEIVHLAPTDDIVQSATTADKVTVMLNAVVEGGEVGNKTADIRQVLNRFDPGTVDGVANWIATKNATTLTGADTVTTVVGALPAARSQGLFQNYALELNALVPPAVPTPAQIKGLRMLIEGKDLPNANAIAVVPAPAANTDNFLHKLMDLTPSEDIVAIAAKILTTNAGNGLTVPQAVAAINDQGWNGVAAPRGAGLATFKRALGIAIPPALPFGATVGEIAVRDAKIAAKKGLISLMVDKGNNATVQLADAGEVPTMLKAVRAVGNPAILTKAFSASVGTPVAADFITWLKDNSAKAIAGTDRSVIANTVANAFAQSEIPVLAADVIGQLKAPPANENEVAALHALYTRHVLGNGAGPVAGVNDQQDASAALGVMVDANDLFVHSLIATVAANKFTLAIVTDLIAKANARDLRLGGNASIEALRAVVVPGAGLYAGQTTKQVSTARLAVPLPGDELGVAAAIDALFP
jgi:hypothetical protein